MKAQLQRDPEAIPICFGDVNECFPLVFNIDDVLVKRHKNGNSDPILICAGFVHHSVLLRRLSVAGVKPGELRQFSFKLDLAISSARIPPWSSTKASYVH